MVVVCACELKSGAKFVCGSDEYLMLGQFDSEKALDLSIIERDRGDPAMIACLCPLYDNKFVTGGDNEICMYDLITCLYTINLAELPEISNPDVNPACTHVEKLSGGRVATAHLDTCVRVWDSKNGNLLKCIVKDFWPFSASTTYQPFAVLFAINNGKAFVTASVQNFGTLQVYSTESYEKLCDLFSEPTCRGSHPEAYSGSHVLDAKAIGNNRIATIKEHGNVEFYRCGEGGFDDSCKDDRILRPWGHRSCILPLQDGRVATGGRDPILAIWGQDTTYDDDRLPDDSLMQCMVQLPRGEIVASFSNILGLKLIG
jgi:WD40 repeat protein